MAKSQKKSNREIRKPKQEKAKPPVAAGGVGGLDKRGPSGSGAKGAN